MSRRAGPLGRWGWWPCLLLGACAQTEPVKLPPVPVAEAFQEAADPWTSARPADHLPRDAWWTLYGDAELDALQQRLIANSPDLAAAIARRRQAQATAQQLEGAQLPTVGASLAVQRQHQSERRPLRVLGPNSPDSYSSYTLALNVDYELDLWGRVRQAVEAGHSSAQAAEAELASARLSLQAQLADHYIALRGLDREAELLREAETLYTRALGIIGQRHDAGLASGLDLARAQAQLETTRSQARQSQAQRRLLTHAIAALVGASPSAFDIAPRPAELTLPRIPTGIPSTLLQRRPDIAAAQRRVAAANASVGVARNAVYPSVTLSAMAGFQSSDWSRWIEAPNTLWAIGPTVLARLFDGGRRKADIDRAEAVLDEAAARYRSVVLAAFQQVEDSLALLARYGAAAASEKAAVEAAERSLALATHRWREGAASYLEVVTSQTATLQARRNVLELATRQRRASMQLIRALGGGWTVEGMQPDVSR